MRAGQARRPRADDRHPFAGRRAARVGRFPVCDRADRSHSAAIGRSRPALPSAASRTQASSHSVSVGQTRAHMPPMMLASRIVIAAPDAVARGDLADEQGNVDRGRAGLLAGRIEAEIAALGLDSRLVEASAADADRRNCLSASLRPGGRGGCPMRPAGWRRSSWRNPKAWRDGPGPFLTVWSIVPPRAASVKQDHGPRRRAPTASAPLTANRLVAILCRVIACG